MLLNQVKYWLYGCSLERKKLTVITSLGSSMRKFRLADGIQPLAQICTTYNICEGRFFPQQYLQTYSAFSTSDSVPSFCSCWLMAEMSGVVKTQSKPSGRDQYLKLWTRVSIPIIFFLTVEFSISLFLIFFWHLPCYIAKELLETQTCTTERKAGREVQVSLCMKKLTLPFHKSRGHF